MSDTRCPYFSLNVGLIPIPGLTHPLRVPVCRCVLTETLAERLRTHPEGEALASYLQGPPLEGQPRPVIGSDLQPVTPTLCTDERKRENCLPQFVETLEVFSLDTTVPLEK